MQTRHAAVGNDASVVPHVTVHAQWPVLSALCGLLVLAAGLLVAIRGLALGGHVRALRSAVDATRTSDDVEAERSRADASMWTALDRGDDPTSEAPR